MNSKPALSSREPFPYAETTPKPIKAMKLSLPDELLTPVSTKGCSVVFDAGYLPATDHVAVIKLQDGRTVLRYWVPGEADTVTLGPINPDAGTIAVKESDILWAFPVWQILFSG